MNNFKPGDILVRINYDWNDHKVGGIFELESLVEAPSSTRKLPPTLIFKNDTTGYDSRHYELHPISGSPLFEALK